MRLDQIDLLEKCIDAADKGAWEQRWEWADAVRKNDYLTGPSGRLRHGKEKELIERALSQRITLTAAEISHRLLLYKKAPTREKLATIGSQFDGYREGRQAGFTPKQPVDSEPVPQPDQFDLYAAQIKNLVRELEEDQNFACSVYDLCEPQPDYMWTTYVAAFDQKEAKAKDEWKEIVREKKFIDKVQAKVPDCNSMTFSDVLEAFKSKTAKV